MNSKTLAREYSFKLLYNLLSSSPDKIEFSKNKDELTNYIEDFDRTYFEPDNEHKSENLSSSDKVFAMDLIHGVLEKRTELESKLSSFLKEKNLTKLDIVDRAILYQSAYELMYITQTPVKVVINEAINIAKAFGKNESAALINGVLDSLKKSNE